jgi:hypothetical protein
MSTAKEIKCDICGMIFTSQQDKEEHREPSGVR